MKMKIVIVNESNLSIEKGEATGEIIFHLYSSNSKDTNMDGKPDGETIVVTRDALNKAINFILGIEENNLPPAPLPPPDDPMPVAAPII